MKFKRKVYKTGQEKLDDYSIGVAFFGGSAALMIACFASQTVIASLPGVHIDSRIINMIGLGLVALVNIGGLAFFAFSRKWIALGILTGIPVIVIAGAFMAMVMFG